MEKENILKTNITTEESEIKKKVMAITKGCLFAIIFSIILLTIYALLLVNTTISENTMMPVVLTRKIKKNGLIYGGIVGLVYILALYLASSIAIVGFSISVNSLLMLIVSVITGIIGGIIGVNLSAKK